MTMDEILKNERLLERFCKDCNIPIKIFKEPYFTKRLWALDSYYNTWVKWCDFVYELSKYKNEQEYFEEYNKVKEAAMDFIKNSEGYKEFIDEDINLFSVTPSLYITSNSIYHPSNNDRLFISIDMKKANYSALNYYDPSIFDNKSWEDFLRKFTNNKHIIDSKYIRQVILGNCNPKRQIAFEKYLMSEVLDKILNYNTFNIDKTKIVSFGNDDITINVTEVLDYYGLCNEIKSLRRFFNFPLEVELFRLIKIKGTDGYIRDPLIQGEKEKIKGVDANMMHFVIRKLNIEEITEDDLVFVHNGHLAKYIEVPEIIV